MINTIINDPKAWPIITQTLEEEGILINFEGELVEENGDLNHENVAILKPDLFYNTKDFAKPPKSVDGIVVVQFNGSTMFYITELKSSKKKHLDKNEIQQKFDTIFQQFFTDDFSHIFEGLEYDLKSLKLWLVCDPLQLRKKTADYEEFLEKARLINARLRGLMAEITTGLRPYRYRGVNAFIEPMLSPPIINEHGYRDILA